MKWALFWIGDSLVLIVTALVMLHQHNDDTLAEFGLLLGVIILCTVMYVQIVFRYQKKKEGITT